MKVLIAAGGTAGHLFPAQELAQLLNCEVVFAGYKLQESPYFHKEKYRFADVVSAPFGKQFLAALFLGTFSALKLLWKEKPDVVVGFGSYHTVPVLLASVLLRKKIVLYESNRSMGKVNRLFAPFAKKVAVQFLQPQKKKFVPIPFFPWIRKERPKKEAALREYGLEPGVKTTLVFGGSQGAKFLNETMPKVALKGQVIHLAGNEAAADSVRKGYMEAGIRAAVKAFESNMAKAYAAADFAVCRSGAGTVAELIRFQIPSLLIPYPFAYGHQNLNAEYLAGLGGAKVLLQEKATPEEIGRQIEDDWSLMRVALSSAEAQNSSLMNLDELVRRC